MMVFRMECGGRKRWRGGRGGERGREEKAYCYMWSGEGRRVCVVRKVYGVLYLFLPQLSQS